MNTQVNATGMNIKAKAEGGIVISNEGKLAWSANATASHQTTTEVIPTSTANCQSWYHAVSDEFDNAKANQTSDKYVNCSTANGVATNSDGVGIWTKVAAVLFANETEYNAAKGTSLDAAAFAALDEAEKIKTPAVTESIYSTH